MTEVAKTEVSVDPEIFELVPMFLSARGKDVDRLEVLAKNSEFEEMARICHTIKGVARPYGFPTLEELARELETECKNKNSSRVFELLKRMNKLVALYNVH